MYEEFMKFLKSYQAGEIIAEEGNTGNDDFFCLLQGKVGIWKEPVNKEGDQEKEKVLVGEIEEKGSYFGEMSALIQEPRTASIQAVTPVKVLQFPGSMLPQMMQKQPKLGVKLAKALAERLKGTTVKQQDLALKRNEIQQDSTQQLIHAKEIFERLFILISGIQLQHQLPVLKGVIQWMSQEKMFYSGRTRFKKDEDFISSLSPELAEIAEKFYEAQDCN